MIMLGRPEGKNHLEYLGIDGRINVKMDLQGVGWRGMDVIGLTEDRDKWWAVVNAVMNLRVP
jgi:hypothetical protein